jgi:phosphoribosylformylglycinamidine synthase
MGDACRALDYPIVSGNVSLYNESKATGGGSAILPTPAIGGVGLMDDHEKMATIAFKAVGDAIWLIGAGRDFEPEIGQSLWLREVHGREAGQPPSVNLAECRKNGEFVRRCVEAGAVNAVHDVSDGGMLVAIAEMALAGNLGANLHNIEAFGEWGQVERPNLEIQKVIQRLFAENQNLFIVTTSIPADKFIELVSATDLRYFPLGNVAGDSIEFEYFDDDLKVPLTDLRAANEAFFRDWMEA